jgi:hypothetical protein
MKTRVSWLVIPLALVAIFCSLAQSLARDFPATLNGFNPIAYWKLDESAASPIPNTTANSGTAGVGTGYIVNDVTNAEPGVVGTSFRFTNPGQAVGYVGSKVEIQWSAAINPNPPFSIEFWAKPNALGSDATGYCPVSSMDGYYFGGNRSGWLFYMNGTGRWEMRTGGNNSYSGISTSTNASLNAVAGQWQHIVGTFDGSVQKLYVNGALAGYKALTAAQIANFQPNPNAPTRIGGSPFNGTSPGSAGGADFYSGNRGWDGWVDEFAIYTNLLSQSTIANHYTVGTNAPGTYSATVMADGPPVGYYHLDEPIYTPADPSTYPIAVNSGTAGTADNATNWIGVVAAQSGPSYSGSASPDRSSLLNGATGNIQSTSNAMDALDFTGNITMLAWIKPTAVNIRKEILAHGNDFTAGETFLRIEDLFSIFGAGDPYNGYYSVGQTPDGAGYYFATSPVPSPANGNTPGDIGNWVFIAGTYDGANWNLYRNGVLMASAAGAGPTAIPLPWSIGARSLPVGSIGNCFAGNIDDAAVLTNALSAGQILTLYYSANVPPHFTRLLTPPSGPVYEGSTLNFNIWAEGNTNLVYQWTSNGVAIPGQTGTNITIANVKTNYSATYACVVTNNFGSATNSVVIVVQTSLPIITSQPKSITRFFSAPIGFSVSAIGSTPITYQWRTNGTSISGATSPTYSSTAVTNWNYDCVLTNIYGSVTSSVAALTVVPLPTGYGSNVVHDAPIAYFRLDETNGTVAHDYVGGNDGTYVACILGTNGYSGLDPDKAVYVTGMSNSYVGNISGAITFAGVTNSFTLEMWVNGPSGQNDASTIICKGLGGNGSTADEQFDIDLNGGNYEFFVREPNATAHTIAAPLGPDGNWHYLVATYDAALSNMTFYVDDNVVGQVATPTKGLLVSSSVIALGNHRSGVGPDYDQGYNGILDEVAIYNYVLTPAQIQTHYGAAYGPSTKPFITAQPASITNYVGYGLNMRVGAGGTVPLSYQWRHGGSDVPGATSNSFVIPDRIQSQGFSPGLQTSDGGNYTVVITNSVPGGSITSAVATVTVLAAPTTPPPICGLVMHLPLDGNYNDTTGRGNNGTAVHSPSFGMPGQVGADYLTYLSDTNAGNFSYVKLGAPADLQFSSNVNFTVAYWVRLPLAYNGGDLPFIANSTNSTFGFGFVATTTYGSTADPAPTTAHDGGWEFSVYDLPGNGVGIRGDDHSIDDNQWHHLVHVIDRKNGSTTYLDGRVAHSVIDGGTSVQNVGNLDSAANWSIGQAANGDYTSGGASAGADIDDVGIWRRALNRLEVAQIYLAAVSNSPAVSYSGAPVPPVAISLLSSNRVQITWQCGGLQSAPAPVGPWTSVPAAAVSPYVISVTNPAALFYRAKL